MTPSQITSQVHAYLPVTYSTSSQVFQEMRMKTRTPQFPPPLFNQYTADVIFVVGSLGVIIQETTLWGYKALMQPWPPHCKTHKSHVEIRIPTQCHISVAGIRASSLQPFWQPPKKKKCHRQYQSTAFVHWCAKRWFPSCTLAGTVYNPGDAHPNPALPLQWHALNAAVIDM